MVGCQVVAILPPLRWYILRSASARRSDAQVQVAGQSARAARVLRRDERERVQATRDRHAVCVTHGTRLSPSNAAGALVRLNSPGLRRNHDDNSSSSSISCVGTAPLE